ncbi:DUF2510 domain-containing protein [Smaragdicoccus niigatensis]
MRFWDGSAWAPEAQPRPVISDDERAERLNNALMMAVSRGGRIEAHTRFQAVVVYGRPVNHIIHAILTVFTCLLWGIVWLIVENQGGEHRAVVQVDPYGNIRSSGLARSR